MERILRACWPAAAAGAAAALILLVACDQEWPSDMTDIHVTDTLDDTLVADTAADTPVEEVVVPCEYPTGPYAFDSLGDLVGPAHWDSAVPGSEETSTEADLEDFYCDPSVQSILVFLATLT